MSIADRHPVDNGEQRSLLNHALDYARRGWSIIPVSGKKPLGLWQPFQEQPADDLTLRRLFAKNGVTGLAVVLGSVSGGLAVRDFDKADAYTAWASQHPDDASRLLPPAVHPDGPVHSWVIPLPDSDAVLPILPSSLATEGRKKDQEETKTYPASFQQTRGPQPANETVSQAELAFLARHAKSRRLWQRCAFLLRAIARVKEGRS